MSYNTYVLGSREFQAVQILRTQAGVTAPVTTGVQIILLPKGEDISLGTTLTPETLNGEIGFYTDAVTLPGYYEVLAHIVADSEEPFIPCGFIRVK